MWVPSLPRVVCIVASTFPIVWKSVGQNFGNEQSRHGTTAAATPASTLPPAHNTHVTIRPSKDPEFAAFLQQPRHRHLQILRHWSAHAQARTSEQFASKPSVRDGGSAVYTSHDGIRLGSGNDKSCVITAKKPTDREETCRAAGSRARAAWGSGGGVGGELAGLVGADSGCGCANQQSGPFVSTVVISSFVIMEEQKGMARPVMARYGNVLTLKRC